MSHAAPGEGLSRQTPPGSAALSRIVKSVNPARFSSIAVPIPPNPVPTISTDGPFAELLMRKSYAADACDNRPRTVTRSRIPASPSRRRVNAHLPGLRAGLRPGQQAAGGAFQRREVALRQLLERRQVDDRRLLRLRDFPEAAYL